MPRLNSGDELFKRLTAIDVYRLVTTTPGNTTTTANATATAATLAVAGTSNFAANDYAIVVGDGGTELVQATTVGANLLTLAWPLALAQSTGATVKEAAKTALGKVGAGGLSISPSFQQTPIFGATDITPIGYFQSDTTLSASFSLLGLNALNIYTWLFATENETGSGTSASPYTAAITGTSVGSQGVQVIRATGTRFDGQTFYFDFCDARIESAGAFTMARNATAEIPLTMKFSQLIYRQHT